MQETFVLGFDSSQKVYYAELYPSTDLHGKETLASDSYVLQSFTEPEPFEMKPWEPRVSNEEDMVSGLQSKSLSFQGRCRKFNNISQDQSHVQLKMSDWKQLVRRSIELTGHHAIHDVLERIWVHAPTLSRQLQEDTISFNLSREDDGILREFKESIMEPDAAGHDMKALTNRRDDAVDQVVKKLLATGKAPGFEGRAEILAQVVKLSAGGVFLEGSDYAEVKQRVQDCEAAFVAKLTDSRSFEELS
jgi:hypothetical protein